MLVDQPAGARRRQVLQALSDNGPLSVAVLAEIVRPKMSIKTARKVIHRLRMKGILTVHFESLAYNSGHFYRISHDRSVREKVAGWLGISCEQVRQPKFFSKELQHTTKCALWSAYLKDQFPDAEVVRDLQVIKQRIYLRTSESRESDRDSVPDIVLNFRGEMVKDTVSVGFEIERTRKSDKRLMWKLLRLVNQTVLDGVVYVCETGGIKDSIAAVLENQKILHSPRIRHYGPAFILFTDRASVSSSDHPALVNAEGKKISLQNWITALRKISADYRRSGHFWKA